MENWLLPAVLIWGLTVNGVGPTEAALRLVPPAVSPTAAVNPAAADAGKAAVSILSAKQAGETSGGRQGKAEDKPLLTFPVLSDVHVQDNDKLSQTKFKSALNDLNNVNPNADALVMNGDLTSGLPEDYSRLEKLMNQSPHPKNTFYTIGNHEFYKAWYDADRKWSPDTFPNGETEQASINRFLQFAGKSSVYYDETIKGYHFIFLGSERYQQSDPSNNEDAFLSPEQLNWLKATLKKGRIRRSRSSYFFISRRRIRSRERIFGLTAVRLFSIKNCRTSCRSIRRWSCSPDIRTGI
ncbi:metallophosphoesterase [Paenibacillus sp. P25]|nr:metallophosphoesterase [Paenibacillus sp. P25]